MTAEPAIRVEGLTVAHGEDVVLRDVSFEVRRGEVFAVLGGSGSGKSTLLRAIIGLVAPVSGRVTICGEDMTSAQGEARRRLLRRIGVAFQGGALFGSISVLDNVSLPLEELTDLPPRAVELVARMKLALVGLEDAAEKMPAELSGGMQKRAALARALALDPEVLFLDEPSAGLDPRTSAGLDELILDLSRALGTTFVVVTHEIPSVERIADRALLLDGELAGVRAIGTPEELRSHADPEVAAFFRREAAAVGG